MSTEVNIINTIESYDLEGLRQWLNNGGDPNLKAGYNDHKTSLVQYVLYGIDELEHDEIVLNMLQLLIQEGANVNIVSEDEFPILYAVIEQKPEIVKLLLEASANIDVIDDTGRTPLTSAVIDGSLELLKLLVPYASKDTIDRIGSVFYKSALGIAFSEANIEMIEVLIKHGANPYLNDIDNMNLPMIENIPKDISPVDKNLILEIIKEYYPNSL